MYVSTNTNYFNSFRKDECFYGTVDTLYALYLQSLNGRRNNKVFRFGFVLGNDHKTSVIGKPKLKVRFGRGLSLY